MNLDGRRLTVPSAHMCSHPQSPTVQSEHSFADPFRQGENVISQWHIVQHRLRVTRLAFRGREIQGTLVQSMRSLATMNQHHYSQVYV